MALFVKDGASVKFCFHRSVTQGRDKITRDVERYGGIIVADERGADVLLVDEQQDIEFIRVRYYSSTEIYRHALVVEPRGFVQHCVRFGRYRHEKPVRQGMPGRAPGNGQRSARVPFTTSDRNHLAFYLATRFPTRDGRQGNRAYQDLVRLGESGDPSWRWAQRHSFHSWRGHYKMHQNVMDPLVQHYVEQLKDVGHHLGHDPRSHDFRSLRRRELAEEGEEEGESDEDEDEEVVEWNGIQRREERVSPAGVAPRRGRQGDRAARAYLARHGPGLISIDDDDESESDVDEAVVVQGPRGVKRHRVPPDASRREDPRGTQAKKARISEASSSEQRASSVEDSLAREEDTGTPESQEIEGSDLFGDRLYEEQSYFDIHDEGIDFPVLFSPGTSPVPEPPSTQATLVASPLHAEKEQRAIEVPAQRSPPASIFPPSSQQTMVVSEERVVVARQARVRGASAQPGPSVSRGNRTQGGTAASDAPYRNTRARSRSAEPQSRPSRQKEDKDQGEKRKANIRKVVSIEEAAGVNEENERPGSVSVVTGVGEASVLEDEIVVEELLEASVEDENSSDGLSDVDGLPELPPYQDVEEEEEEPSDSDDAETHEALAQGAVVREGSVDDEVDDVGGEFGPESESEEQERGGDGDGNERGEEENAERVERMAGATLHAPAAPVELPRATRSRLAAATQMQVSPLQTRSSRKRADEGLPTTGFPSPGTKARVVVDRIQEQGRSVPYEPPRGSRAARAARTR